MISQFFVFIEEFYYVFAVVFWSIAGVLVIANVRWIGVVIGLFVAMYVASVFLFLLYLFAIPYGVESYWNWLLFAFAACLGGSVALGLWKFPLVGLFFVGSCFGFFATLLMSNLFFHYISGTYFLLWLAIGICTALGGISAYFFYYYLTIFATALTSSYFFYRGVSLFTDEFPNEFTFPIQIQNGDIESLPSFYYLFLVLIIISAIILSVVFVKMKSNYSEAFHEKRKKYICIIDIYEDRNRLQLPPDHKQEPLNRNQYELDIINKDQKDEEKKKQEKKKKPIKDKKAKKSSGKKENGKIEKKK